MAGAEAETLQQFTAVAIGERAMLIQGPPGCGKTSLALALMDRGAVLVGDDGVALHEKKNVVWASPPQATRGLIEVRNVGLCKVAVTSAPVALILTIKDDAPRFIESAGTSALLGCTIPTIRFKLGSTVDHLRAKYALDRHGLTF